MTERLEELLERVEKATGPSLQLDCEIQVALDIRPDWAVGDTRPLVIRDGHVEVGEYGPGLITPSYTASIDAALGLVERCLPGKGWQVSELDAGNFVAFVRREPYTPKPLATAPLAILAALLRALIARENDNG